MPATNALLDRDLAIYQDFCHGVRKVQLAEKYGLNRNTITEAIDRAISAMPVRDRTQVFDQSLEIVDAGLGVFVPKMLEGDKGAGRLVDRLLGRRNEMLGLDSPAKLELYQAQGQVQAERVDVRAELAALLTKIRGEQHGR